MKSETETANRRAAWRWGTFVVGLLGLQVAGGIFAIMLATGDKSVAVVPDYHQKALKWDEQVAMESASRSLQWVCDVQPIDESANASGLRITLSDRDGNAIDVLSGELQLYRLARAAEVRRVQIPPGSLGQLDLSGCFDFDGLWQVTLDVHDRSGNHFAHSTELSISNIAAADSGARAQ